MKELSNQTKWLFNYSNNQFDTYTACKKTGIDRLKLQRWITSKIKKTYLDDGVLYTFKEAMDMIKIYNRKPIKDLIE